MDEGSSTYEDDLPSGSHNLPKRQKTFHHGGPATLQHASYTVAWICALHIEMAAALAVLDEIHDPLQMHPDDNNSYKLGRIKTHNVVIACLPAQQYGTINAATVVTNLKRTFPSIRAGLMVGIGGGVPSKADIRLGDVVVGTRVMQYDLGKAVHGGEMQRTAIPRLPHQLLGTAVSALRSKHELATSRIPFILQQKFQGHPGYGRPISPDRLFCVEYDHENPEFDCDECDQSKMITRSQRNSGDIVIHYGAIASGNQVMKNGNLRDSIAREMDVVCFEMEAAGLMETISCLVIRGICDYADSHKSKEWQRYAAAVAAAYARELLDELPTSEGSVRATFAPDPQECRLHEYRQRLMESLRFEQINSRKVNIKAAHNKTCKWFLSHPDYKGWLDHARLSHHHGFLWISGKPGAGKSTIMKFLYSNMKSKVRRQGSVVASFFFNARGEYLEKSIFGMYRSLLLQLLEGCPVLQSILDNPDLIPHNHVGCPSLNVLKDLFSDAIMSLGEKPFTCFVDALDECDEQQVVEMVQYFEDLAEQSACKGVPFRLCFSSRHYPYIVIKQGIRLTLEDQTGHFEDLETYVASRLQIEDPTILEDIQPQLLSKAAGVFMWVVLVVDILNKEYRRGGLSLRRRLAEIPSDLSELFRDILRRDNENMEDLLLCILWILYAKRPLQPKEFYHALWSGLSLKGLVDDRPPVFSDPDSSDCLNRFTRCVISSSKGLAEIAKSKKPIVQFIHESVRDFLIKDKGLQQMWPELGFDPEGPSHEILKQCCNIYMDHMTPWSSSAFSMYPFSVYACQHVLHHSDAAAKSVSQDEFLRSFPLSRWIRVHNVFEEFAVRHYKPNASDDYILADRGCSNLIRQRIKNGWPVHFPSAEDRYIYPIFAALAGGHKETVAALLNVPSYIYDGEDITKGLRKRGDLNACESLTPLTWAAQEGRTSIVKLLLLQGLDPKAPDRKNRTPLYRALENGHVATAKTLISSGVSVKGVDQCESLYNACKRGFHDVVGFLLDIGAETEEHDGHGRTPLSYAAEEGHHNIVRLLIEKGASVNTRSQDGSTPLFRASQRGHKETVQLLIDNGADVNLTDNGGGSPLSFASSCGHEDIVRLLLEKGADFEPGGRLGDSLLLSASDPSTAQLLVDRGANCNSRGPNGETPLLEACRKGLTEVFHILLAGGAEVETPNDLGDTPLLQASSLNQKAMVIELIDRRADVNARNIHGWTPLLVTADPEIAQLLIDSGADCNARNVKGVTPLLRASGFGPIDLVQILIQGGADVNARSGDGRTPLMWALSDCSEDKARLLIIKGADIHVRDERGDTPLLQVTKDRFMSLAKMLISRGADVNARNKDRKTPFLIAARNKDHEFVTFLLECGANSGE